jgi:hypothetical protein
VHEGQKCCSHFRGHRKLEREIASLKVLVQQAISEDEIRDDILVDAAYIEDVPQDILVDA